MKILDWLLGVIINPVQTFREIARDKPIGWAFLLYLGITTLTSWVSGIDLQEFNISPLQLFVGSLFFSIVMFFVLTGLLNLLSKGFQGTGSYWGLFSSLAFAQFPTIFLPVSRLLGQVADRAGSILAGIFSFAVFVWVLVLDILALRESQEFSTGKSILAYVLVCIILAVFFFIALVVGVLTMPEL